MGVTILLSAVMLNETLYVPLPSQAQRCHPRVFNTYTVYESEVSICTSSVGCRMSCIHYVHLNTSCACIVGPGHRGRLWSNSASAAVDYQFPRENSFHVYGMKADMVLMPPTDSIIINDTTKSCNILTPLIGLHILWLGFSPESDRQRQTTGPHHMRISSTDKGRSLAQLISTWYKTANKRSQVIKSWWEMLAATYGYRLRPKGPGGLIEKIQTLLACQF